MQRTKEEAKAAQPPATGDEPKKMRLGALPSHVELGEHLVGSRQQYLIAAPFLLDPREGHLGTRIRPAVENQSRPSAFRDQLGLDPEQVLAEEAAIPFKVVSHAAQQISTSTPPAPILLEFAPDRPGRFAANVLVEMVGYGDHSHDSRDIRVSASACVDRTKQPDLTRATDGTVDGTPARRIVATDLDMAAGLAKNKANLLARNQQLGVRLAKTEISSYQREPVAPSMFDQLIDIAFMMGISGVAGIVGRYVSRHVLGAIGSGSSLIGTTGRPAPAPAVKPPANSQLGTFITDGVKDGFKGIAKSVRKGGSSGGGIQAEQAEEGSRSSNVEIDFFHRHELAMNGLEDSYVSLVDHMKAQLASAEPGKATAAVAVFAEAMDSAAGVADVLQARATELQWIASTARQSLGDVAATLPDGSQALVANLDEARNYGARDWYKPTSVSPHDGVLDIHVDLPVGSTPVETSGFKVRRAAITGISQEAADRLMDTNLREAGISIRLVVHGHPALITRDEIGRVRVNGYLLTEGQAGTWTEDQMHRGATFLVDRVLSRTLAGWGVKEVKTDDATGRRSRVGR